MCKICNDYHLSYATEFMSRLLLRKPTSNELLKWMVLYQNRKSDLSLWSLVLLFLPDFTCAVNLTVKAFPDYYNDKPLL